MMMVNTKASIHVNLESSPGVLHNTLWHWIRDLPYPVMRNEADWLRIYEELWTPGRDPPSAYVVKQLFTRALLFLGRQERLLLVSILFMISEQVDTEVQERKLSTRRIEELMKLNVFFFLKAM